MNILIKRDFGERLYLHSSNFDLTEFRCQHIVCQIRAKIYVRFPLKHRKQIDEWQAEKQIGAIALSNIVFNMLIVEEFERQAIIS